MHIYDIDLNLLKIFDAVYRAKSVSRAAERLAMTQPSVSHGLARLRHQLGDALFVRHARGVAPTAQAHRLARVVGDALGAVQVALDQQAHFDAATARRVFRLHLSDFGEAVFLPRLAATLALRAPQVALETCQLEWALLPAALEEGRLDLAIGYLPTLKDGFEKHRLFREQYVMLVRERRGRTRAPQRLIAVSSHPPSLALLAEAGLSERVALTVPHFMSVPAILAEIDMGVVVPRMAAERFAHAGRFQMLPLPGPHRRFDVALHWSTRQRGDPANRWLREIAIELFAKS